MRDLIFSLAAVALITGCAPLRPAPGDFLSVWTQTPWPPEDLPPPPGFKVTPRRAYEITRKGWHRSLKHAWHLYADSRYYYIEDVFLTDAPRSIYRTALRIDGRTGAIVSTQR